MDICICLYLAIKGNYKFTVKVQENKGDRDSDVREATH